MECEGPKMKNHVVTMNIHMVEWQHGQANRPESKRSLGPYYHYDPTIY